MKFLLSFPPGIEDIVLKEFKENVGGFEAEAPMGVSGRLVVNLPRLKEGVFSLRSVDSVREYVGGFSVGKDRDALAKMYGEIVKMDFPDSFQKAYSFRVTCERHGVHGYTSMNVERTIGQALVDKYGLKVDLNRFEAEVLIEILDDVCLVSIVREEYLKNDYYVFTHPAALKRSIAYAMLRLAEIKPGMTILDPMCGGGTILIEAALTISGVKIYGFDVSEYFLEGAILNSEAAGISDKIFFGKIDCRKLSYLFETKVDRIITNPPYGTKPIAGMNPYPLYSKCLLEMKRILAEDGLIVLITVMPEYIKELSLRMGLKVKHERIVKHDNSSPEIIVLTHA
ncbi:MAG: THUMP domain-containing protein [Thermoproteota archaeon]